MIREGEHVILKKGNALKSVEVRKGRKVQYDRLHFALDNAIGCPLGSMFEITRDGLIRIDSKEDVDELLLAKDNVGKKSNQFLQSDETSQKLSRDDIISLKKEGVSGNDIVEHLVKNSATFEERTEFSKAKYKDKKKKKHINRFSILRPTTDLIAEMYYSRGSSKICDLRLDTLSQLLTMANVRAHCRMAVVESCQGLVVGALLERLGGYGSLVQVYSGDFPGRQALEYFNFSESSMECLCGFPMDKVTTLASCAADKTTPSAATESNETDEGGVSVGKNTEGSGGAEEDAGNSMSEEKKLVRIARRKREETKGREELEAGNLDCLVVVSRFQPSPILTALLPRLAPSRPFVVFCQYKEPLMECFVNLRERGRAININLTETWWRHYQVLPARTHPEITMNSTGGYLLSGITVEPETTERPEVEPPAKRVKLNECG